MKCRVLCAALAVLALGSVVAGPRALADSPNTAIEPGSGSAAADGRAQRAGDASRSLAADPGTMRNVTDPAGASPQLNTEDFAGSPGRNALTQPQCTICLEGSSSVQWAGTSGSYQVDGIGNFRASGTSGTLDLRIALSSTMPVWGYTITYYTFTDIKQFNPLAAGFHYTSVNSGTVGFYPSLIPAGQYYMFMYLREFQGGSTYAYTDFAVMNNRVTCNGVSCSTVSTCIEDANTMCLVAGRYRVTSYWQNQYAGGAQSVLFKSKLTDTTGAFWIANASTYEYLIRFNTATDNGRAWIAIPTFTDVEFFINVTDTVNGQSKQYHSAPGNRTLLYDPYYFVYP
ncbi:MAG TPA: hypothetical protein VGM13_09785 [Thermoanaerobaculia bacterium]|jgi:hypothetical protein